MAVALSAVFIPASVVIRGQCGGCTVTQSQTGEGEDFCDNETYDLQFSLDYGYGQQTNDAGQYRVGGACYVYTDCNCQYENGAIAGSIWSVIEPDPGCCINFCWDAENIIEVQYNKCSDGTCQSNGVIPQQVSYYDHYISYSTVYCFC